MNIYSFWQFPTDNKGHSFAVATLHREVVSEVVQNQYRIVNMKQRKLDGDRVDPKRKVIGERKKKEEKEKKKKKGKKKKRKKKKKEKRKKKKRERLCKR